MEKITTMPVYLRKIFAALLFLAFLFCFETNLWSQSLTQKNWYFGSGTLSLQFGRPAFNASIINKPGPFGVGGGAVCNDANSGNLLFYTDGNNVYDVSQTPMPNSGLGGNTGRNQSAVITPVPGTPNQYYIFTMTAGGTVEQAIVQTDAPGSETFPTPPLGNVISKNVATGLNGQSEGMIIIPHPNGIDSWLITQTAGSDSYTVTSITSGGLVSTVVPGSGIPLTAANFSFHKATGRLAVAPKDQNKNVVVLNFNTNIGTLTFDPVFNQFLLNTGVPSNVPETIYDTEWSIDGNFLYISRHGDASVPVTPDVLQVNLTSASLPVSILPGTIDIVRSFGLQMGPDSAIYHLYENSTGQFLLGKITDTDSLATLVGYTREVFPSTNFNAKQFPSFSPPAQTLYNITFVPIGTCTNSPITFFTTVTPAADSVVWDFGDGTPPVNSWSPVHTFQNANSTVTATAFANGISVDIFSQPLSLTSFDLQLTLQPDTTACSCELKFPKIANPPPPCSSFTIEPQSQGGASPTYQWYGPSGILDGKISLILDEVDSAGYYYVKATDGGCSVTAGQNIKEYHVSDQRANIWYFGNTAGIDFNPLFFTPPLTAKPIVGPVNSDEGVAVICDQNGQIVLSTDGYQVYDRNGNPLIPSAPPSPVNPASTQSSLVIPVQGDETLYYIFTTEPVEDGTYRVNYMLFDLKLGTIGGIVDPDNNPLTDPRIVLYTKSTERLTGNNNWLISHEYGNNSFRAYNVSANGLGAPVISDIGSDHSISSIQNAQGYMRLGAQNRLAVALSDGSSNVIELFDFIDSTGAVTNFRKIDLNEPAGQIYGLEFSPGANKLYATVKNGGTSTIYEYAIDALGVATLLQKTPPISGELGAIQTGPDGQIYIAVNGGSSLLFFGANENILQPTAGLTALQPFNLAAATNSTLGLPNFIQTLGDPIQSPSMTVVGNCVNSPIDFSAIPSDDYRDEYTWLVRDQNDILITSSTEQNFQFTFTTAGTYKVSLDITSDCLLNTANPNGGNKVAPTFTQNLVINPLPGAVINSADGSNLFCLLPATKSLVATSNSATVTYNWSTGETVNPIVVTQPGGYDVTITDSNTGCFSTGTINLFQRSVTVDLGLDFAICSDETRSLNAQNPALGNTYQWEIDNVVAPIRNGGQAFPVDQALTGIHEYKVTVSDGTCSASDVVMVTVNPIPTFLLPNIINQPGCGISNGEVRLEITSAGTFTVDVSGVQVPYSDVRTNQSTGAIVPDFTGLSGGTYNVVFTNDLTGCDVPTSFGLSNTGFLVDVINPPATCSPTSTSFTHSGGTGTGFSYILIDKTTGTPIFLPVPFLETLSPHPTVAIAPGSYVFQATDGFGCIATDDLDILALPSTEFTLDPTCEIITATPTNFPATNATYLWTGPPSSIVAGTELLQTVQITPGLTRTINVTVSDNTSAFCPSTQSIDVIVETITPAITSTDPCADIVTLSATPVGSFSYDWTTPSGTDSGPQIIVTSTSGGNGNYEVEVTSILSGCKGTSAIFSLTILDPVTVDLTSTLPCEGQEFTLTAIPTPSTAAVTWTLNGTSLNNSTNQLVTTVPGKYKVQALVNGCAPVSKELPVTTLRVDEGFLPGSAVICNDPNNPDPNTKEVTLIPDPSNIFESYAWSTGEISSTILVNQPGIYSVDLTNFFGCTSQDQTEVVIECNPLINAPNAFRPGSSISFNIDFHVYPLFVSPEDFQIFIFNRWGEMIYQSDKLDFKWNGTYNNIGAALPPGTYSWVAKYKSSYRPEEGIKEKRGGVVLLR